MAMSFPPQVEQWRSTVAKYFPPELVDKALWVIQYESGGNPGAVGDGGAARGLFQIQDSRNFAGRPDAAYLDNPENNIAYAANNLGAASGNWGAWGEGTLYNGQPFGALGNHPFPGNNGQQTMPDGRVIDYSDSPPGTYTTGHGPGGNTTVTVPPQSTGNPEFDAALDNYFNGGGSTHHDPTLGRDQFNFFRDVQFPWQQLLDDRAYGLDRDIFDHGVNQDALRYQLDQAIFGLDKWATEQGVELDQAAFEWKKQLETARLALDQGNLDLARDTLASSNHWAGQSAALDSYLANLQNQGQQYDLFLGAAGIRNQDNANQINLAAMLQAGQLGLLDDDTRRYLGELQAQLTGQSNQTSQFGAETDRASSQASAAQAQNELIARMASSPRDLPALFMMARGMAPDWNTVLAGGNPAQGTALTPQNALSFFNGLPTGAPDFSNQPGAPGSTPNPYAAGVAAVGNGATLQDPFGGQGMPGSIGNAPGAQPFNPPPSQPRHYYGAPDNLPYTGDPLRPRDTPFTSPPIPVASDGVDLPTSTPGGIPPYTGDPSNPRGMPFVNGKPVPQFAYGGGTTATKAVVGDPQADGKPNPETILNPTGAPLYIQPMKNQQYAAGGTNQPSMRDIPGNWSFNPMNATAGAGIMNASYLNRQRRPQQLQQPGGATTQSPTQTAATQQSTTQTQAPVQTAAPQQAQPAGNGAAQQWADAGFGGQFPHASQNQYLQGMSNLPNALQQLARLGYPVPPSVANLMTGRALPRNSFSQMYAQRGGGALPSLQQLRSMSTSEREHYLGIMEGVLGIPQDMILEGIGQSTAGLGQAARARAA